MDINEEIAQDRYAWRNIVGSPTPASAGALHIMCINLESRMLNAYADDDDDEFLDLKNMDAAVEIMQLCRMCACWDIIIYFLRAAILDYFTSAHTSQYRKLLHWILGPVKYG